MRFSALLCAGSTTGTALTPSSHFSASACSKSTTCPGTQLKLSPATATKSLIIICHIKQKRGYSSPSNCLKTKLHGAVSVLFDSISLQQETITPTKQNKRHLTHTSVSFVKAQHTPSA